MESFSHPLPTTRPPDLSLHVALIDDDMSTSTHGTTQDTAPLSSPSIDTCRGLGGDETGETEAGVVGGGGSGSAGGPETAAELAFGTDKERHVGSVLILPEHRVETHVFDDDGGGGGGPGADDAAGGLVNLSLVDHPPPGVNRII